MRRRGCASAGRAVCTSSSRRTSGTPKRGEPVQRCRNAPLLRWPILCAIRVTTHFTVQAPPPPLLPPPSSSLFPSLPLPFPPPPPPPSLSLPACPPSSPPPLSLPSSLSCPSVGDPGTRTAPISKRPDPPGRPPSPPPLFRPPPLPLLSPSPPPSSPTDRVGMTRKE